MTNEHENKRERRASGGGRRIVVDADACPALTQIIDIAGKYNIQVTLVGNETQNLQRFKETAGVSVYEVADTMDAADFKIASMVRGGDVVVTSDTGLAYLALSKEAIIVSPRGRIYNPVTIEATLGLVYEAKKARRSGVKIRGPAPYSEKDRSNLVRVLQEIISP